MSFPIFNFMPNVMQIGLPMTIQKVDTLLLKLFVFLVPNFFHTCQDPHGPISSFRVLVPFHQRMGTIIHAYQYKYNPTNFLKIKCPPPFQVKRQAFHGLYT